MNPVLIDIAKRVSVEIDDVRSEIALRLPLDAMGGIAALVQRIDGVSDRSNRDADPSSSNGAIDVSLATFARYLLACRRRRETAFDDVEFGEPAWDMLLELYAASVEACRVSVSRLSLAAGVPSTTASRWIEAMTADGHFVRHRDERDGRRSFITLSPGLFERVDAYLREMREKALAALL